MLLGLLGYGTSGKDAVGSILVRDHGFTRLAFADPLKDIARDLYGWNGAKDDAGRRLLQSVGMEYRERMGADYWLRRVFEQYDPSVPTVITDVRLPNEIDAIRERGGLLLRIDRPGVGPANEHITESAWRAYAPDAVIVNDGTLEDLERAVEVTLRGM